MALAACDVRIRLDLRGGRPHLEMRRAPGPRPESLRSGLDGDSLAMACTNCEIVSHNEPDNRGLGAVSDGDGCLDAQGVGSHESQDLGFLHLRISL